MPRYQAEKEFQLGDYWLSKQKRSNAWCRTWYDKTARQTRRASLGTTDFQQAKDALTDWFVQNHRTQNAPAEDVTLAEVLSHYWEDHARHLSSGTTARLACKDWLDYFGEKSVGDISLAAEQEGFHEFLRNRQLSNNAINRVLTVGRAAINRAWKRGEISSAPHIRMLEAEAAAPMGRPLDFDEVAALIKSTDSEHLYNFMILALATAARPDAVRELQRDQLDFDNRLIVLNRPGRKQTKKYRPTVKMPECLAEWLHSMPEGHLVSHRGKPVGSVKTAWKAACRRAKLDSNVNPYSLRHTMARWLRKEGVPAWEVAAQLGHKQAEFNTTEIYAPFDPSYLENAVLAIDGYLDRLRVNCVVPATISQR